MPKPVPGPDPRPLIGTVYAIDPDAPMQSFAASAQRYGELYRHVFPGGKVVHIASSQRIAEELCDESRFGKLVEGPLKQIRAFAGDGLFTAHGDEANWGKAHRILMSSFSPVALRDMYDGMCDVAEQLMLKWERFGGEAEIDVADDFTRLTLDAIALCSFSYRFNSFYSASMHPFVGAMMRALEESGARGRRLPIQNQLMRGRRMRYERDIRTMHAVADELIAQRRANPLPDGQSDILDVMLRASDPQTGERLSDENVRYQMVTFLIAGHETTSGLLSFAVYELLRNPEVLRTARAIVDEELEGRFPEHGDLPRLGYLDQILRETLRLWPTAPGFMVTPHEATVIGESEPGADDGYRIEPGDAVLVHLLALHRDPAAWPDPERFDPGRFDFERAQQIPPSAWRPFGNGQRSCIGRGFALQEAQLVLALILQRFDMSFADPAYELKIKETLTLKPDDLRVRFAPRADGPAVLGRGEGERTVPAGVASAGPARAGGTRAGTAPGGGVPAGAARADAAGAGAQAEGAREQASAAAHATPVRVLFGSNAGTCEAFAGALADEARRRGYDPSVAPLDSGAGQLRAGEPVLIVTASYEGQPPDNARAFVSWLGELPQDALRDVPYAVFGCGNTDWARTYQRIPALVDEGMARAGAQRVHARGEANARGDFFGDFAAWSEGLWPALAEASGAEGAGQEPQVTGLRVEIAEPVRASLLRAEDFALATVTQNLELTGAGPGEGGKHHIEVRLPAGQRYRAGDYLAVLPRNPAAVVERALARFGLAHDAALHVTGHAPQLPAEALPAGELLASYVELSLPAGRRQIEQLAEACPCPPERDALLRLTQPGSYEEEVLAPRRSLLDLLERFASVQLPFEAFLGMLAPLSPRRYSISSSPRWDEERVTLTIAHVREPARSGSGVFEGVASSFLASLRPGARLLVSVRPGSAGFRPPEDVRAPIVMACAGSGIAPFRGFLQDRVLRARAEGVEPGPALLFFGCREPGGDDLYRQELDAWQAAGVVDVRRAYSRAPQDGPDGPVRYVQDRMWADRADIVDFVSRGATVYVCGDGERMAPAVRETCARIYADAQGAGEAEADAWLDEQEREHGRYVTDVFA